MTDNNQQIEQLVHALSLLLQPYNCVGIRTDYLSTDTGTNRRCLVVERHGKGSKFAVISKREHVRPRGVKALENALGMPSDVANQVLDLAEELSEFNDLGAWPLQSHTRDRRVASAHGVDGVSHGNLPGFESSFSTLANCLGQVDRVRITADVGNSGKGFSRKAWVAFFDRAGNQLASLPINLLATSLREWFGSDPAARASADRRLGRWASQSGSHLSEFITAALTLLNYDSTLGVTEIQLGANA